MEEKLVDSEQAAAQIGITVTYLHTWLHRHPEYKPGRSFGGSYQWSEEEIAKVIERRQRKRKAGDK